MSHTSTPLDRPADNQEHSTGENPGAPATPLGTRRAALNAALAQRTQRPSRRVATIAVAVLAAVAAIAATVHYKGEADATAAITEDVRAALAAQGPSPALRVEAEDLAVKAFYSDAVFSEGAWSTYAAMAQASDLRSHLVAVDSMTARVEEIGISWLQEDAREALRRYTVDWLPNSGDDAFLNVLAHTRQACAAESPQLYVMEWSTQTAPAAPEYDTMSLNGQLVEGGSSEAAKAAYQAVLEVGMGYLCP